VRFGDQQTGYWCERGVGKIFISDPSQCLSHLRTDISLHQLKNKQPGQVWWRMLIIPATQEVEVVRLRSKAGWGCG
jgi:hypothetical protein